MEKKLKLGFKNESNKTAAPHDFSNYLLTLSSEFLSLEDKFEMKSMMKYLKLVVGQQGATSLIVHFIELSGKMALDSVWIYHINKQFPDEFVFSKTI